jgi:alcohol dehydrogenase (cytochrome c)
MARDSQGNGRLNGHVLEAILVLSALTLAFAAGVAGWAIGHYTARTKTVPVSTVGGANAQPVGVTPAPAFSTADLAALPADNWITNGGSTLNERYSPLKQIDTSNVANVKGVWHIHLKSATAAKYSAEGQPLVYAGVIYLPTGNDDVFAVDLATGKVDWTYYSAISQKIATVCCGWDNRGVAIGDGKVYLGRLDGALVALDMKTGKVAWTTQVARWQDGYTITSAPLYWDGRVYTGISGGEYGGRGRVTAFDASTGKELWRFYTVPGPGQVGHNTWPSNDAWKNGGAMVWQTPAVDPALGLLYFSTSNAAPDFSGGARAGDNLFASSIVAIDAKSGTYKWHFQEVHHDIWDYDAPSPVVLFDVNGKKAIAQVGKTGFSYVLDRSNGKPLYGINEKAVPQRKDQATAPTQPFPVGDATVRQDIPPTLFVKFKPKLPKGTKYVNGGRIFTPYGKGFSVVAAPSALGGTNWPPSSYNPSTQYLYVCGSNSDQVFSGGKNPKYADGKQYLGSAYVPVGSDTGTFTAMDMRSNKMAWQKQWPDRCYSGSMTTGGGLVFTGRNDGRLQAYDASSGSVLWNFQTGAGANNVATVVQQNGNEYIVFYAGGSALGATAHGDDLWLFGLNGRLGQVKAGSSSGGVLHTGEKQNIVALGAQVFANNCSGCHGTLGQGGNGGPDLQHRPGAANLAHVIKQVTNGGGGMPPFKGQLTPAQIKAVATYVTTKIHK